VTDLAAENARLRARIEELTDRVIAAETGRVDAADLQRENTELRRALADTPTTEAAIGRLREWCPDYDPGASYVAMPVTMARKLLAKLDRLTADREQLTALATGLYARLYELPIADLGPTVGLPVRAWLHDVAPILAGLIDNPATPPPRPPRPEPTVPETPADTIRRAAVQLGHAAETAAHLRTEVTIPPRAAAQLADWLTDYTGFEFSEHGALSEDLRHALGVSRAYLAEPDSNGTR
jgi:hypothetical protein